MKMKMFSIAAALVIASVAFFAAQPTEEVSAAVQPDELYVNVYTGAVLYNQNLSGNPYYHEIDVSGPTSVTFYRDVYTGRIVYDLTPSTPMSGNWIPFTVTGDDSVTLHVSYYTSHLRWTGSPASYAIEV